MLCAEHQGEEQTRVPCPYDSSHTVWLKQMDRHLAKCPRRPRPLPVYAQPGVNIPPSPLAPPQPQEAQPAPSLKSVPAEQLKSLIARLRLLMAAHPLTIAHHIPQHPFMQDEIAAKKAQGHSYKHLVQMSSMLGHLQERGLLREGQAVVELGAGKAQFLTAMRRVIGWQSSAGQ